MKSILRLLWLLLHSGISLHIHKTRQLLKMEIYKFLQRADSLTRPRSRFWVAPAQPARRCSGLRQVPSGLGPRLGNGDGCFVPWDFGTGPRNPRIHKFKQVCCSSLSRTQTCRRKSHDRTSIQSMLIVSLSGQRPYQELARWPNQRVCLLRSIMLKGAEGWWLNNVPSQQAIWNLQEGPFKRQLVFQDPPVRFHVNWWEGR